MDIALYPPMKTSCIVLLLLPVSMTAPGFKVTLCPPTDISMTLLLVAAAPTVCLSQEKPAPPPNPLLMKKPPAPAKAPVVTEIAEEPKPPVQSLEENGGSMLFEVAALQGTPFAQSVVMPFD